MSDSVPQTFKGFAVSGAKTWNQPKLVEYEHKKILPTDVVLKNICCGVCASDVHTVRENWAPVQRKDLVVGHEIVGHVVAVGDKVKTIKVGDRIGIGAATNSCGECRRCKSDNENYCMKVVSTYNAPDESADGYITQGGYSSHSIADEKFCFPIPENLDSAVAAPLMCAGLTVYSPLVRIIGKIEKPVVAVVGIGGLGHLAVQFAKGLGAEVVAFSRGTSKKEDALKLGADGFVATKDEDKWEEKYSDKFDLVLNCASGASDFPLEKYLQTLKVEGKLHSAGLPPSEETFSVHPMTFSSNFSSFSSSHLGSKKEALDMLQLAADKGIKPLIEKIPITEKGTGQALTRCGENDVRYRFVLTDFEKAFA